MDKMEGLGLRQGDDGISTQTRGARSCADRRPNVPVDDLAQCGKHDRTPDKGEAELDGRLGRLYQEREEGVDPG